MRIRAEYTYAEVGRMVGTDSTEAIRKRVARLPRDPRKRVAMRGHATLEQVVALTGLDLDGLRTLDVLLDDELDEVPA